MIAVTFDEVRNELELASGTLARVAIILVAAFVARFLLKSAITRSIERARTALADVSDRNGRRTARIDAVASMITSIVTWVIATIALLLLVGEVGINLGPLLAGAGVAGIAVAFGAQTLIRDLLAGFSVLLEDQYGVGDQIIAGPATGVVERVTLRSTQVRDIDGTIWHIPNGSIDAVGNRSQALSVARVDVVIHPQSDIAAARTLIAGEAEKFAEEEPWASGPISDTPVDLGVAAVSSTGVTLRVEVRTRPDDQWIVERALRERLIGALVAAGIALEVHHPPAQGT